jgi:hypothetical protein
MPRSPSCAAAGKSSAAPSSQRSAIAYSYATQITHAPVAVSFTNVATLFDTCELGPDFDLHGLLAIGATGKRSLFEITVNLARLALAGPFALTTPGGGMGVGIAQFNPADPSSAPQQCATSGVSAATLAANFNTVSPLVGTREAPPPSVQPSTPTQTGALSAAHSVCASSRPTILRLHAAHGRRIVAVDVFLDGRLIVRRRGRQLKTAALPALAAGSHSVRIVARLNRRGTRVELRRYTICARR